MFVAVEDVLLVEFMFFVFTRMPGGVTEGRFRSLLLCPLSVERYYFPFFFLDCKEHEPYQLCRRVHVENK